jgi:hypothetical protein
MLDELHKDCLALGAQAITCIKFVETHYEQAVSALFAGETVMQACQEFTQCWKSRKVIGYRRFPYCDPDISQMLNAEFLFRKYTKIDIFK